MRDNKGTGKQQPQQKQPVLPQKPEATPLKHVGWSKSEREVVMTPSGMLTYKPRVLKER